MSLAFERSTGWPMLPSLPASVDSLRDLCRREMWESAAAGAHRLAGSGGAYGLAEITREAKNLERLLRSATGAADWEPALKGLDDACVAARGSLQPIQK